MRTKLLKDFNKEEKKNALEQAFGVSAGREILTDFIAIRQSWDKEGEVNTHNGATDAFGIFRGDPTDGVEHQRKLRDDWDE